MIYQSIIFSIATVAAVTAAGTPSSLVKMSNVRQASKIAPQANDGSTVWVKNTFYEGSCSGSVIKTLYWSTSVCLTLDGTTPFGSMSYSCNIGGSSFNQTFYDDTACTTASLVAPVLVGNCFINDVDDDGYLNANGAWDYNEYSCSTSAPSPLSGASVSSSVFASTSCDSTELFTYNSMLQDTCYNNNDGTTNSSFTISVPYGITYNGFNCNPVNVSTIAYQPIDSCVPSDIPGTTLMYNTYSSDDDEEDDDDDSSSNGLNNREKLGIGIGFGFLGGLIVATFFMWCFCHKKTPMAKEDGVNNI